MELHDASSDVVEVKAYIPPGYHFKSSCVDWDPQKRMFCHTLQWERVNPTMYGLPPTTSWSMSSGSGVTPHLQYQPRAASPVADPKKPTMASMVAAWPKGKLMAAKKPIPAPTPLFQPSEAPPMRLQWSAGVSHLANDALVITPDGREMTVTAFRAARQEFKRQKKRLAKAKDPKGFQPKKSKVQTYFIPKEPLKVPPVTEPMVVDVDKFTFKSPPKSSFVHSSVQASLPELIPLLKSPDRSSASSGDLPYVTPIRRTAFLASRSQTVDLDAESMVSAKENLPYIDEGSDEDTE